MAPMWQYPVSFDGPVPSLQAIQDLLSENSGLAIRLEIGEMGGKFYHPEFSDPIEFQVKDNAFVLFGRLRKRSYLQWALLNTLAELGGSVPVDIPGWAKAKWETRRWWRFLR
jgi:hypothetical protein